MVWIASLVFLALAAADDEFIFVQVQQRKTRIHRLKQLQLQLPIAWIHIPKCGSNFYTPLMLLPGVCNANLLNITEAVQNNVDGDHATYYPDACSIWRAEETVCGRTAASLSSSVSTEAFDPFNRQTQTFHCGVDAWYESNFFLRGVTMMRQPEQRLLSSWYSDVGDGFKHSWKFTDPPKGVVDYARVLSGCSVKMLTRTGDVCGDPAPANDEEVARAISRLQNGFQFVGIVEHWDESICLLHKMFGGFCYEEEFAVTHTGPNHTDEDYDTTVLGDFVDKSDGALYDAAMQIFRANQELYDASVGGCSVCFQQAGIVGRGDS